MPSDGVIGKYAVSVRILFAFEFWYVQRTGRDANALDSGEEGQVGFCAIVRPR